MKKNISIVPDPTLTGDTYGCLINGELHVAPLLYKRIYDDDDVDHDMLMELVVIDVDELVYTERLNDILVFAGQQVKVYNDDVYLGDGTVTCYPYNMHFEHAEVMMHFPLKGEVMVYEITSLVPVMRN